MINKRFKTQIAKTILALTLAASLPATALPTSVLADPVSAAGQAEESAETTAKTTVDGMLTAGDYTEGRVIALFDTLAGGTDEELVGASGSSALSKVTVIDRVSGQSYTEASGEADSGAEADEADSTDAADSAAEAESAEEEE